MYRLVVDGYEISGESRWKAVTRIDLQEATKIYQCNIIYN